MKNRKLFNGENCCKKLLNSVAAWKGDILFPLVALSSGRHLSLLVPKVLHNFGGISRDEFQKITAKIFSSPMFAVGPAFLSEILIPPRLPFSLPS